MLKPRNVLALLLAGGLVLPQAVSAQASSPSWSTVRGTVGPSFIPAQAYCIPHSTDCIAAGNFDGQARIKDNFAGKWAIAPGSSPATGQFYGSYLNGISCTSVSFCVAVGGDAPSSAPNKVEPLVETFNGTSWTFQELDVSTPNTDYSLEAITCLSATDCIAVGGVAEGANFSHTLIETFDGTAWTPTFIPNPGIYKHFIAELDGVSCMRQDDCVAVGLYAVNENEGVQGFSETLTSHGWSRTATPVLSRSNAPFAVSCSAVSCVAVGDRYGQTQTLIERYTSGKWAVVTAGSAGELRGVSCPTRRDCAAVGETTKHQPLVMTSTSGRWSAQPVTQPIMRTDELAGLSCASTTMCLAAGYGINGPEHNLAGYLLQGGITS